MQKGISTSRSQICIGSGRRLPVFAERESAEAMMISEKTRNEKEHRVRLNVGRIFSELKKYSLLIFLPLIFGIILVPVMLYLVNSQMDSFGRLTADFFKSRMSVEMSSVESVVEILGNDGRLSSFLDREKPELENERDMIARIASSVNRNDNIREIYLLDGVHGYIYSSNAAYIYSPENTVITSSEIASMNLETRDSGWHMMDEDGSIPYYLLNVERFKDEDIRIVAVFDREEMSGIMRSIDAETGAVFNEDGYVALLRNPNVDWTDEDSVSNALGTKVKCFYSEANGFNFVAALAYRTYRKPVIAVIWIFAVYFAALIIAGLIFLVIMSRRERSSWRELAEILPHTGSYPDNAGSNELREDIRKTLLDYRERRSQYDDEQKSHLIRSLLKARVPEPDLAVYEDSGIPSDASGFCVMSVYAEDYSDMMFDDSGELSNIDYSRFIFRRVIENAAQGRVSVGTAGLGRVFAVILCFKGQTDPDEIALDIARKTAEFIESNYGLNLHIAVSGIVDELNSVALAYQETEKLQEYMRFLEEETAIVSSGSLSGVSDDFSNNGYSGQIHILESMLEAEKYDYIPDMVSGILRQYVKPLRKNYRIAQSRTSAIACILAEAVLYCNIAQIDTISLSARLRDAQTASQLESATEEVFKYLALAVSDNQENDPVNLACRYIDEHFRDPDLQVSDISSEAGLSPQHLNRLFHKKLGIKVTGYLQRQRIRYAKQLLQDTDLQIADIALRSGYNSQSTFSYNFRNQENISPGAYREWLNEHRNA